MEFDLEALRQAIRDAGLRQEDLARETGYDRSYIGNVLSPASKKPLTVAFVTRVALALDRPVTDFIIRREAVEA